MKSKRNNKKHSRTTKRSKRGGGFFSSQPAIVPAECNMNNLEQLTSSEQMHANYQTCCPKTMFGLRKNKSTYCTTLDNKFKTAVKAENNNLDNDTSNIPQPTVPYGEPKKSWYNFWGGKKTKKHRKDSRKHRK